MAKNEERVIGSCKIFTAEMYTRQDGTYGYKCVAMCDDGRIIQAYRPGEENPQKDDVYDMVLRTDNQLRPIVRLVKRG